MGRCVGCRAGDATCTCLTDATLTGFGNEAAPFSVDPDGTAAKWRSTVTADNPTADDHVLGVTAAGDAARFPAITVPAVTSGAWLADLAALTVPAATSWVLGADAAGVAQRFLAVDMAAWADVAADATAAPLGDGDVLLGLTTSPFPSLRRTSASGRGGFVNGNDAVSQRGNGPFTAAGFNIDRHGMVRTGSTMSTTRTALAPGTLPGQGQLDRWYQAHVVTSVAGAANLAAAHWSLEGVDSYAGLVVTVSMWMKASTVGLLVGGEWEQGFGTGGSPSDGVYTPAGLVELTTGWARYAWTFTVPSMASRTIGTNGDDLAHFVAWFDAGTDWAVRSSSVGRQSGTFSVAMAQLDVGPIAAPWRPPEPSTSEVQCYRHLYLPTDQRQWHGQAYAAASAQMWLDLPVSMRRVPSFVTPTGAFAGGAGTYTNWVDEIGVTTRTPTTITAGIGTRKTLAIGATGATSLPAYAPAQFNASATIIGASCE